MTHRIQTRMMIVALAAGAAANATAGTIPIDISTHYNTPAGFTGDPTLPAGTFMTSSGVTFEMGPDPLNAPYLWSALTQSSLTGTGNANQILDVAVNLTGVSKMYTLMNTSWGSTASGLLEVQFIASDGYTQSFALIGGDNIRNWLNSNSGGAPTTLNPNGIAENVWSGVKQSPGFGIGLDVFIDMQTFELDSAFLTRTLETMRIIDRGATGVSRAQLWGVSGEVASVMVIPLPGAGALGLLGLSALVVRRRRCGLG